LVEAEVAGGAEESGHTLPGISCGRG
jgi:hypothetical protein